MPIKHQDDVTRILSQFLDFWLDRTRFRREDHYKIAPEVMSLLIAGADPNYVKPGSTRSIERRIVRSRLVLNESFMPVIKFLYECGADFSKKDETGVSSIDVLRLSDYDEINEFLNEKFDKLQ